jgi:lipopolysaccharide/colanic/teichoic acid biosynthesis glycosyltransferase
MSGAGQTLKSKYSVVDKQPSILNQSVAQNFNEHQSYHLENIIRYNSYSWKRIIDITGALVGLLLFSPFILIHILIMKIVSPGTVFFKQERVGLNGIIFLIYKFRTMKPDSDEEEHKKYIYGIMKSCISERSEKPMRKKSSDPRVIRGAGILRSSSFDEIPQLINVLKGEMSLVGPRPCLPYEAAKYAIWQRKRFGIMPGMTGLWQIKGKNRVTFKNMIRLDVQYAKNCSLLYDLYILFMTGPAIITQVMESSKDKNLIINSAARKKLRYAFARPLLHIIKQALIIIPFLFKYASNLFKT